MPRGARRQDAAGLRHQQPHLLGWHGGEAAILVGLRVGRFELPPDQGDVGLGLRRGDTGLEPAFHEQPSHASAFEGGRADRRRH